MIRFDPEKDFNHSSPSFTESVTMDGFIKFCYVIFLALVWIIGNAFVWPIVGDIWDANGFLGVLAGAFVIGCNLAFIGAVAAGEI